MESPRLALARLPTPLEAAPRLTAAWGGPRIWVKRDDLTGFGLSGNKVRKLEYHLAAARAAGAETIVTCGALQSNHCRATALAAARLGLRCVLFLRTPDGEPPSSPAGNHLLQRLAGAACRFVDPDGYADRRRLMRAEASRLGDAWVIPEGASDALGALGFADAAEELMDQLAARGITPAAVWHPASSGGTTAGLAIGAHRRGGTLPLVACSVGDPAADLEHRIRSVLTESMAQGTSVPLEGWETTDAWVGAGYGEASPELLATVREATRLTGLLFDPTYTGKALYGLREAIRQGRFSADDDVVFWHTGGGFAVFAWEWGLDRS